MWKNFDVIRYFLLKLWKLGTKLKLNGTTTFGAPPLKYLYKNDKKPSVLPYSIIHYIHITFK